MSEPSSSSNNERLGVDIDLEYLSGDGLIEINQFSTSVDNNERDKIPGGRNC